MAFKPLPREFYLRDAIQVAQELIGKELVHSSSAGITSGVIVETEAYMGVHNTCKLEPIGESMRRRRTTLDQKTEPVIIFSQ